MAIAHSHAPDAPGPAESTLPSLDEVQKLSVPDALARLGSVRDGLSPDAAQQRLERYGPNAIAERTVNPFLKFLRYFWGPIPWMIEVAVLLSAVVRDWPDVGIISALLIGNALIGFWQESKADSAMAALKQRLAAQTRVRRGGKWMTRDAADLVPGDVVRIRLGDVVPADLKVIAGDSLDIDQSVITGESLAVTKQTGDVAYSGSVVQRGEADAVVVATGMRTFFGKTAQLVEETTTVSHYQRAVLRIGHFLILLTAILVSLILMVALFRGTPLLETVQFALILTVAAIPAALPAVLSVTMAIGAVALSRRQAIVTRLVSIEELAGMDVLCSDKTGTLTQNRLELGDPVPVGDVSADRLVLLGALASRAENQDPIDLAVIAGLADGEGALAEYEIEDFHPFDPVGKHTEAVVRHGTSRFRAAKGAPQVMLDMSENAAAVRDQAMEAVDALAARGFRTLGVATAEDSAGWQFLGILPLYDPPREDSAETIRDARDMGVAIKMVTGDHLAIAKEIAGQLKLGQDIHTAEETFGGDTAPPDTLLESCDGFAQVYPEHKYRIVEALQRLGHFVGMTGDGVNDAPALKKADVGVAVSGATEAARTAADLVLTAPGLSVIVDAVRESRRIFRRMTSYATYRIAETIRVLLFMTLSILVFDFYPVTAVMIVILAMLNDGPIMMIAYDNAEYAREPVRWDMHKVLTIAGLLGVLGVFASFGMFWLAERVLHLDRPTVQTLMFLKLTVAGHMTIYLARTGENPFWSKPWPSLALFGTAEATQLGATLFAVYGVWMAPIGWTYAGMVWAYALVWFGINELVLQATWRLITHQGRRERTHLARMTR